MIATPDTLILNIDDTAFIVLACLTAALFWAGVVWIGMATTAVERDHAAAMERLKADLARAP